MHNTRIRRFGCIACVGALVALHCGSVGRRIVGDEGLRDDFLRHQQRMRESGRRDRTRRDDDARAHPGPVPHLHGKRHRHADAAVRRRIARQYAGVQRNARPGDALHVRHRCAAVDVGAVHLVLLDDAEHAHRGRMTLHARRHRALGEQAVGVVDADLLLLDRDRDDQWPLRLGVGFLDGCFGLGGRPAGLRLARLCRRHGPVVGGVGVLPIEQGGSICLRNGNQATGRRQHRYLPKSPFGIGCARNTRAEKPIPVHAPDPQIRLLESTLPIIICCRRGEKRSPA